MGDENGSSYKKAAFGITLAAMLGIATVSAQAATLHMAWS